MVGAIGDEIHQILNSATLFFEAEVTVTREVGESQQRKSRGTVWECSFMTSHNTGLVFKWPSESFARLWNGRTSIDHSYLKQIFFTSSTALISFTNLFVSRMIPAIRYLVFKWSLYPLTKVVMQISDPQRMTSF